MIHPGGSCPTSRSSRRTKSSMTSRAHDDCWHIRSLRPSSPAGWEEVDKAIAIYKPDSWKSYTIGDPLAPSKFPWRLDDEQVMYPFYDKAVKAGINTLCIHKGLLPPDYEKSFAGVWEYATAWDIGKAAKDWPQMNFVIYHSALRPFLELPDRAWRNSNLPVASDGPAIWQRFRKGSGSP